MATQLTRNQVKNLTTSNKIFRFGYCEIQSLLRWEDRIGYCCGVYGWNCDIYYLNGFVIATGYRTDGLGAKLVDYETARKANERARNENLNAIESRELLLSILI